MPAVHSVVNTEIANMTFSRLDPKTNDAVGSIY
jgi:hypothetical protein